MLDAKLRTPDGLYKCRLCWRTFPSKYSVIGHYKSHYVHSDKPYTCDKCDRRFTSRGNLRVHVWKNCPLMKTNVSRQETVNSQASPSARSEANSSAMPSTSTGASTILSDGDPNAEEVSEKPLMSDTDRPVDESVLVDRPRSTDSHEPGASFPLQDHRLSTEPGDVAEGANCVNVSNILTRLLSMLVNEERPAPHTGPQITIPQRLAVNINQLLDAVSKSDRLRLKILFNVSSALINALAPLANCGSCPNLQQDGKRTPSSSNGVVEMVSESAANNGDSTTVLKSPNQVTQNINQSDEHHRPNHGGIAEGMSPTTPLARSIRLQLNTVQTSLPNSLKELQKQVTPSNAATASSALFICPHCPSRDRNSFTSKLDFEMHLLIHANRRMSAPAPTDAHPSSSVSSVLPTLNTRTSAAPQDDNVLRFQLDPLLSTIMPRRSTQQVVCSECDRVFSTPSACRVHHTKAHQNPRRAS